MKRLLLILLPFMMASISHSETLKSPAMTPDLRKQIVATAFARMMSDFSATKEGDEALFGFRSGDLDKAQFDCNGLGKKVAFHDQYWDVNELGPKGSFDCSGAVAFTQATCDDGSKDRGGDLVRGHVLSDGRIVIDIAGYREPCDTHILDKNDKVVYTYKN